MGREIEIRGFTYLPRQDGNSGGLVEHFRFETSVNGTDWVTNVEGGRFGNIRNNPFFRRRPLPGEGALLPLHGHREPGDAEGMSAAEISVLATGTHR
jgi:alpha-L-fucosidase